MIMIPRSIGTWPRGRGSETDGYIRRKEAHLSMLYLPFVGFEKQGEAHQSVLYLPFVALEHLENSYSISFQIECDMIMVTVFLSILNQMEILLVQKIEKKTVTTIISNLMWKEMEI